MATTELDAFEVSTDPARLDVNRIEAFLKRSYWAADRTREDIETTIRHSLCLGIYRRPDGLQVGFCRVVTDRAVLGWVCDVFIDESCRGLGLGKLLIETLVNLPELRNVQMILATQDAHGLYQQYGFERLVNSETWMYRPRQP